MYSLRTKRNLSPAACESNTFETAGGRVGTSESMMDNKKKVQAQEERKRTADGRRSTARALAS
jgi:hypothetical protein